MKKKMAGKLWIGTSNIVLPGTKSSFPAGFQSSTRLHFYSSLFNTLEVNSSFYKIPMHRTFEKWSMDVPGDFQFTVKLWREVTHVKGLKTDLDHIDRFMTAAAGTGTKKGCLLVQFPGKITLEYYNEVEQILLRLREQDPEQQWRIALEFRSSSWYVSETHELLDEFGASLVLHDIPKSVNADVNKRAKFIYLRFHGPAGDYRGSYSNDFLRDQYTRISGWLRNGKDVYVYFNNTIGSAFENARSLQQLARGKGSPVRSAS